MLKNENKKKKTMFILNLKTLKNKDRKNYVNAYKKNNAIMKNRLKD